MKKKTKYIVLAFTISLLLTLVSLLAYAYITGNGKSDDNGGQTDNTGGQSEQKIEKAASIDYSDSVSVGENKLSLYFKNADRSSKNMSLEVVVFNGEERISLAKTGVLKPGDEIRELDLATDLDLAKGKYSGEFELHFYNDEGKEEIVDSKIKTKVFIK